MTSNCSVWLMAMRLRTLPLACSSILLGAGLAARTGTVNGLCLALALLTAILLQILSNLANDYGDALSGADNASRIGPARAVVSGLITPAQMRVAMGLMALAASVSGLSLLAVALGNNLVLWLLFIGFGLAALAAALAYTMGKRPYGYQGLGDVAVFIFFGLLGVLGSAFLFSGQLLASWLLPASSCGLLAAAVLNINNVRDIKTDAASGKITLAVRLGRHRAIRYHWALLLSAWLTSVIYLALLPASVSYGLFLPACLPLWRAARTLRASTDGKVLTGALKITALSAFAYCSLLSLGLVLA
ncbi:MAG: 1,4-dihydroxy-2-naphthoate octaprenyltransferase [Aeromonas sp.]